jgi:hypothetical protein
VDTLTVVNLFIGHSTGGILLALFTRLFVSELFLHTIRRVRKRRHAAGARRHIVGKAVTVVSMK